MSGRVPRLFWSREDDRAFPVLARLLELDVEARQPLLHGRHDRVEVDTSAGLDGTMEVLASDAGHLPELECPSDRDQLRDIAAAHLGEQIDLASPDAEAVERQKGSETFERVIEIDALPVGEDFSTDLLRSETLETRSVFGHGLDDLLHGHFEPDPFPRGTLGRLGNPPLLDRVLLEALVRDRDQFLDLHHEELARPTVVETGHVFKLPRAVADGGGGEAAVIDE